MSRILRKTTAVLFLAGFVATAPAQALSPGRRSLDGPARIESVRGFLAFILRLFDFAKEGDTGGAMDPNGVKPTGPADPNGGH
jgi:hypothetical protein